MDSKVPASSICVRNQTRNGKQGFSYFQMLSLLRIVVYKEIVDVTGRESSCRL